MLRDQLAALIETAPKPTLDNLARDVWKALAGGLLGDNEAQELAEAIHRRRHAHRTSKTSSGSQTGPGTATGAPGAPLAKQPRAWSYFPAKRPQRSPDKARSVERRRTLAASAPLPPALASKFTTGELAVLRVVADEVREKGTCVLSVPELAARAGVGQTKVRAAIKIAAGLGLLTTEERRVPYQPNLPNVVRIVSREWLAWITRGQPKAGWGGGSTFLKATDNKSIRNKGVSGTSWSPVPARPQVAPPSDRQYVLESCKSVGLV